MIEAAAVVERDWKVKQLLQRLEANSVKKVNYSKFSGVML